MEVSCLFWGVLGLGGFSCVKGEILGGLWGHDFCVVLG